MDEASRCVLISEPRVLPPAEIKNERSTSALLLPFVGHVLQATFFLRLIKSLRVG